MGLHQLPDKALKYAMQCNIISLAIEKQIISTSSDISIIESTELFKTAFKHYSAQKSNQQHVKRRQTGFGRYYSICTVILLVKISISGVINLVIRVTNDCD
ncbi:MAG: hypothetical protein HRT35_35045 [Algicola sp.]|nr:hypothetical protein [Algicola sp.]